MDAYREGTLRRSARRAFTVARAVRAGRTRRQTERPPERDVDGAALRRLLAETAADARHVTVDIKRPRWTTTSIEVAAGEQVTWLSWGYAYVIRPLAIGVWPRFAIACRVANGPVQQSGRDTFTFTADRDGVVELASLFPGELRPDGTIAGDRIPYRTMTGNFAAVVVRWAPGANPRVALEDLSARDESGLCAAEAARLAHLPAPPVGWHHHPLLRPGETYTRTDEGIVTRVRDAVGIIRRPVDMPLTSSSQLRWSWRLEELPSELPEDTTLTHDYLSIGVEFDDGQDLTWYWSCALPEGVTYRCPFDHWRRRETHVVVRSGSNRLGSWVEEQRRILADHRVAIGGSAPARIVAVWLISCSFLQGNVGRGEFGRIELIDGDCRERVL